MDKDKLVELAERCEAATGSSRHLDTQIFILLDPDARHIIGEEPGPWPRKAIYGPRSSYWEWALDETKEPPQFAAVPSFTASLDAAMTLVPVGWRFAGSETMHGDFYAHLVTRELAEKGAKAHSEASAKTFPLALCAAALRSHAQPK